MSKGTTTIILLVIAVVVVLASFMPKARKDNPSAPVPANASSPGELHGPFTVTIPRQEPAQEGDATKVEAPAPGTSPGNK